LLGARSAEAALRRLLSRGWPCGLSDSAAAPADAGRRLRYICSARRSGQPDLLEPDQAVGAVDEALHLRAEPLDVRAVVVRDERGILGRQLGDLAEDRGPPGLVLLDALVGEQRVHLRTAVAGEVEAAFRRQVAGEILIRVGPVAPPAQDHR